MGSRTVASTRKRLGDDDALRLANIAYGWGTWTRTKNN